MEALLTDQDLDQFIWNCIENSTNARDFVDYLNHTYGTFAEQEAAYQKILTYWGEADTPRQFDKAVAGLTEQAESGKGVALSMSEATRLISKAASLGDKKSIEWVDTHYPDKPDWSKTLCLDSASKE